MKTISLLDLYTFLDATPTSRNVNQGEAIVNANHIIFCCSTKRLKTHTSILAYVSQGTATTTGRPLEVTGEFKRQGSKIKIMDMTCTCKAATSNRCEHVAAVLLYCSRMHFDDLEQFTADDLKCLKPQKGKVFDLYEDKPLMEYECMKRKQPTDRRPSLTKEEAESCLEMFVNAFPDSLLAQYYKRK